MRTNQEEVTSRFLYQVQLDMDQRSPKGHITVPVSGPSKYEQMFSVRFFSKPPLLVLHENVMGSKTLTTCRTYTMQDESINITLISLKKGARKSERPRHQRGISAHTTTIEYYMHTTKDTHFT